MNLRPLGPERRNACKIKAFRCFLVLLCRNKKPFRTFRHTVSVQSEAVDGQRCGQAFFITVTRFDRGAKRLGRRREKTAI